jgi:hypothetical protein
MNEEFLHYLWKFRLPDGELRTESGETVSVIHPGQHNRDGGPDFFNARVRIGDTLWAGNIEIHFKASGWYAHGHHEDHAYDTIILHVVYENDVPVTDMKGNPVQTLSLKGAFPESMMDRYDDFLRSHRWIPCEQLVSCIDPVHFRHWAPCLATEFQSSKMERFHGSFEGHGHDWDDCFHTQLFRSFGFRINATPFEMLAKSIPLSILRKYVRSLSDLEALLFGQAGLLDQQFTEEYPLKLKYEYAHLRSKHSLEPIDPSLWKFLRLRPSNFPTIRIAQLAAMLYGERDLFSLILRHEDPESLRKPFGIKASEYWSTHYVFGKLSPGKPKFLGDPSIDLLIVNLVVPFLFFYGDAKKRDDLKEKGLTILEQLKGERNSEIERWGQLGFPVSTALETQALLQLKRNYCERKKCLECRIGNVLLGSRDPG